MKEALFLKNNVEKWKQYEEVLVHSKDPDRLSSCYIELTDDFAYARTFYPGSKTVQYLNNLSAKFHQQLYKNKNESPARIWSFWQYELPYLFRQYHRHLLYAFLFFIVFTGIGVLSANGDHNFIRLVLGDHYVNMTLENIGKGDPFGIYKHNGALSMFMYIAYNNIKVAFLAYVFGITGGVLTVMLLMYNGIMLGAFETFFFQHGLGWNSLLTVFIHGTVEISVIIIAGCAGLILGSSLLFPKTYDRVQSLLKGGRDAMKIVFGLVPFFILAAFFEGFVTRHYLQIPVLIKVLILLASVALVAGYFVIYPVRLHRKVAHALKEPVLSKKNKNFTLWLNKKLTSEK
jgi:uncharacterized membrane protein SpoIIM required for sporulation